MQGREKTVGTQTSSAQALAVFPLVGMRRRGF